MSTMEIIRVVSDDPIGSFLRATKTEKERQEALWERCERSIKFYEEMNKKKPRGSPEVESYLKEISDNLKLSFEK